MTAGRIRVLVVDDSAFMRKLIPAMLARDPGIEVAGTAMDGLFALQKAARLRPDVVTLDLDMPRMHGLEALRHLVQTYRLPVVVLSAFTPRGAELTLTALELGAVDFLTKPRGEAAALEGLAAQLIAKVRVAARGAPHLPAGAGGPAGNGRPPGPPRCPAGPSRPVPAAPADRVLAIGISTGGPQALSYLLPRLPRDFPAGILLVQHMPEGFTRMLAERLHHLSQVEVQEAREGDLVLPGRVLVAPGDRHLTVAPLPLGVTARVTAGPGVRGHRPSVDVLFASVADVYGPRATALLMTGMGDDGVEGLARIRAAGGQTWAQSEDTCVVPGMPGAAVQRGVVDRVVSLEDLPGALEQLYGTGGGGT